MAFPQLSITVFMMAVLYGGLAGIFALAFRTEQAAWRFTSCDDLFRLIRATLLANLTFLLVLFTLQRALALPRSVVVLTALLDFAFIAAARIARRAMSEGRSPLSVLVAPKARQTEGQPLLLVGDLAAADAFLRELERAAVPEHRVTGIVGNSLRDVGLEVRGASVIGDAGDLGAVFRRLTRAGEMPAAVLFLDQAAAGVHADQAGQLRALGVKLLRLPRVAEMDDAASGAELREISVEELLARSPIHLDVSVIRRFVSGKRVLITGGGGSIGSELCRQVAALGCSHLTVLDQCEFALFKIDMELARRHGRLSRGTALCDVRDSKRVRDWFVSERPDVVFHAAALKHVHLVEQHPAEGVLTNVVGTWNVAEAASACGAKHMVLISTDKAVAPSCVMGATKRIAESVIRAQCNAGGTQFSVVRFGNVLGSAGSVVPIFQEQIQRGGPVTITHPEVERFFMTIPEAVQLVLHATAQSALRHRPQPTVFVLDMGKPVKIYDLAKRMIELCGKAPGKDIEFEFIGLRPGEKLTEDLVDCTESTRPSARGVVEVIDDIAGTPLTRARVAELEAVARWGDAAAIHNAIFSVLDAVRSPMLKAG